MIRGYSNVIFAAENSSGGLSIQQIKREPGSTNAVKKEIWKLNGSKIVAFENDSENVQDDTDLKKNIP